MFYHLQIPIPNNTRKTTQSIYDPPSFPSAFRIKQFNQKIIVIITNKLLVNTMIHLIFPFFHHLIQIFKQTILKIFLNLKKI